MCECIKEIQERIKNDVHVRFSKKNKPVSHFHLKTTLGGRAVIDISISLENQYKCESSYMVAEFCPWCGVKYEN